MHNLYVFFQIPEEEEEEGCSDFVFPNPPLLPSVVITVLRHISALLCQANDSVDSAGVSTGLRFLNRSLCFAFGRGLSHVLYLM
jgi:hypothetical protein